jgi:hypothetical protein
MDRDAAAITISVAAAELIPDRMDDTRTATEAVADGEAAATDPEWRAAEAAGVAAVAAAEATCTPISRPP